ncbi:alpha-1,3-mannosyl-glycoprotein 4-beta-N-acetylglucosaminyltransferase C-like [Patiria miniata]|uniref:Alpha-1,3-mannosyl-glycoprotein 4-beta-N-acetylglucosaminyltransferase C n=1 Tax=Patiria miniata TaxID=46514 RepID=A0A913ZQ28_PATMI|nr:alpha-1,3-mannosyl-glycoprotein 4-beta-N-acetylglucosaminyltransferase C-like [Patiria miniata]
MQGVNIRTWNRLLICAVLILFALNIWLVRTLLNATSDVQLLERSDTLRSSHTKEHVQQQAQVLSPDSRPQLCSSSPHIDRNKAIVLGHRKHTKDFLTIGIPTVKRHQQSYLEKTLDSIIQSTSIEEQASVTVVIFSANFDEELNNLLKVELESTYREHFTSGFMQLITAPNSFYPPLENLKQNFGDSKGRVSWRAKQVADYAFLFSYCQGLSEYYLQLEDDVISSPDFVQSIKNYLDVVTYKQWTTLEFSELGFIGKLFRSSELPRLTQFMLFFYEDQPVDYLQKYYNYLNAQEGTFRHAPSLFQHIGMKSSLRDKEQELIDKFFEDNARKYHADNPPAVLYSSMEAFSMYTPQLAYSSKPGYFWGKTPITGDTFLLVFESPAHLSRVVMETGSEKNPDDYLRSGKLEASPVVMMHSLDGTPRCADYRSIGKFTDGRLDVSDLETTLDFKTTCLQITITKSQQQWLLIKEIAVWVHR